MLRINGGPAGSGTKRQTPAGVAWTCSNGHACKAYHVRCLEAGCNEKRP